MLQGGLFNRWNKQHNGWGHNALWRGAGIVLTCQSVCFWLPDLLRAPQYSLKTISA